MFTTENALQSVCISENAFSLAGENQSVLTTENALCVYCENAFSLVSENQSVFTTENAMCVY